MIRKSQFVAASLIVILLSAAISYAVSASTKVSLLPTGSTRYALDVEENQLNVGAPVTWEPTLLSTSVTVPAGKTADVTVLFCAAANAAGSFTKVRAKIGGALLLPSDGGGGISFAANNATVESHCMNFTRKNVPQGTKTVQIQWYNGAAGAQLFSRHMFVILNIH